MKYHQGKFIPKNPQKYVGDVTNIYFRSSWERKAMVFFDTNPSVLKWGSEEIIIPYISPVDGKPHRYFPDFIVMVKKRDGSQNKVLVEVKPKAQCSPPKQPKRKTARFINEAKTYMVNEAKWIAAKQWCSERGVEFLILDEYSLGIKK